MKAKNVILMTLCFFTFFCLSCGEDDFFRCDPGLDIDFRPSSNGYFISAKCKQCCVEVTGTFDIILKFKNINTNEIEERVSSQEVRCIGFHGGTSGSTRFSDLPDSISFTADVTEPNISIRELTDEEMDLWATQCLP